MTNVFKAGLQFSDADLDYVGGAETARRIERHAACATANAMREGSSWKTHSPIRADLNAALPVADGNKGVVYHCHAGGCAGESIIDSRCENSGSRHSDRAAISAVKKSHDGTVRTAAPQSYRRRNDRVGRARSLRIDQPTDIHSCTWPSTRRRPTNGITSHRSPSTNWMMADSSGDPRLHEDVVTRFITWIRTQNQGRSQAS